MHCFAIRRLQDDGQTRDARVVDQTPKRFQADLAFADMGVSVGPAS